MEYLLLVVAIYSKHPNEIIGKMVTVILTYQIIFYMVK